jgi:hypothetical protein
VRGGAVEERSVITSVVDGILKSPTYSDAIIVFIPENAPAIAASHLHTYIMGYPRVCTMSECAGGRPGVPKTNNSTRDMQYLTEAALAAGNVAFAQTLITYRSTPAEMKTKLLTQMENYRWDEIPSASEFADKRFKLHGKSGGQNDDLLVSALMIPFWATVWMKSANPDYAPFQFYAQHGMFREFVPVRYDNVNKRYVKSIA